MSDAASVVVVGGGLAGLAATVALASAGCRVTLLEARRTLGGRAASFRDSETGEWIDACQHVSMGCCTNLADFARRTGLTESFRRDRVLHFAGLDGRVEQLAGAGWLPAPLHLMPGFLRLRLLTFRQKLEIASALWKLMRMRPEPRDDELTAAAWLTANGQSPQTIERFWSVILTSALGDLPERVSISSARKVMVDGFLSSTDAYTVEVPRVPLAELYGSKLQSCLDKLGVETRLGEAAATVREDQGLVVELPKAQSLRADCVVLAVPWHRLRSLLSSEIASRLPWLAAVEEFESAPIAGVHLWFDRPIMELDHVAIVGRMSQWIFRKETTGKEHYYQVVISGSHELAGRDRGEIVATVCRELADIWPETARAKLGRGKIVNDPQAVFSPRVGIDPLRPDQASGVPGLFVAGDWTRTGWPATMEGAVRSGYLAADRVLLSLEQQESFLVKDLRPGILAKLLIRSSAQAS